MTPPSGLSLSFLDHSDELTGTSFFLETMDATNYADVATARDEIEAAVNDVTLCNIVLSSVVVMREQLAYAAPTNPYAQREIGLRVSYEDNVTHQKSSVTIGGADLNELAQPGTDEVKPTSTKWQALVTALETYAKSHVGNPITVLGGRLVGRAS